MAVRAANQLMEISSALSKVGNVLDGEPAAGATPEAVLEMEQRSNAVLSKTFEADRTVLHLFFVAKDCNSDTVYTKPDVSIKELFSAIIKMAASQGWPLYLEATSAHSRGVPESFGFRVVEEVTVGVGRVNEKGVAIEDGRGVSLWMAV